MKNTLSKIITTSILTLTNICATSLGEGKWIPITPAPDANGGVMIAMSDGSILCKSFSGGDPNDVGNIWNKLTPDIHGSYANGTWTSVAPMHDTRLYFSSQLLMDGRLYVAGGEYGTGLYTGEVYNPLTDIWTSTPSPGRVSDANSEILADGRVLQGLVDNSSKTVKIYNPTTNTYSTGPTALGVHNESAWVKLPDDSILFVDIHSTSSERYIPATNKWVRDAAVPVKLYDDFGWETGGAVLLPNGKAFFIGATSNTALYTPSGSTANGTWTAGPIIPGANGAPDAPMAMMSDGKVLFVASPVPTSADHFPPPTTFYEYDYITNTITQIGAPGGGASIDASCYIFTMLDLPDGSVMGSMQDSNQYYIYKPNGAPLEQAKPTITKVELALGLTDTFTLTGKLFNGICEGASYGDDWQMNTNYPIIRLTSGTNVYYARTFNWNSTSVMTGDLVTTTNFTVPMSVPVGAYSLVVTANGVASDPMPFFNGTLPAPTAVAASDGKYEDHVDISWASVAVASEYSILRAIGTDTPTIIGTSATNSFTDLTAESQIIYNYSVIASWSLGSSAASASDTGLCRPFLSAPTNVVASAGTFTNKITLTWDAIADAAGYTILRKQGNGEAVVIGTSSSASFSDETAQAGILYSYYVSANAQGVNYSNSAVFTGWKKLSTPINVTASNGTLYDQVSLKWDAVEGATSYKLMRSVGNATPTQLGTSPGNSYSDFNVAFKTTYKYAVIASCALGNSANSSTVSGIRSTTLPAPTNVRATDGTFTQQVLVSWDAVSGANSYKVFRGGSTTAIATLTGNAAVTYGDTSATTSTVYSYTVQAMVGSVISVLSAADSGFKSPVAVAPLNVAVSNGTFTDKIQIQWSASPGAISYEVFRNGSTRPIGTTTGNASVIYNDTTTAIGVIYSYQVKSVNMASASPLSVAKSGFRNLAAPLNVRASDSTYSDKVRVTWEYVPQSIGYIIFRSGTATAIGSTSGTTATTFNDTTAALNTVYIYTVKSVTSVGVSVASIGASGSRALTRVTGVVASNGTFTDKVQVKWAKLPGATSYKIYRNGSTSAIGTNLGNASTTFNDTTAVAGLDYTYTIVAVTVFGNTNPSDGVSGYR